MERTGGATSKYLFRLSSLNLSSFSPKLSLAPWIANLQPDQYEMRVFTVDHRLKSGA